MPEHDEYDDYNDFIGNPADGLSQRELRSMKTEERLAEMFQEAIKETPENYKAKLRYLELELAVKEAHEEHKHAMFMSRMRRKMRMLEEQQRELDAQKEKHNLYMEMLRMVQQGPAIEAEFQRREAINAAAAATAAAAKDPG